MVQTVLHLFPPPMSVSNGLARWIRRYGVAEVVGGCAAIGGSWLAHALGAAEIVTAGVAAACGAAPGS